jgi:hypothetical protein
MCLSQHEYYTERETYIPNALNFGTRWQMSGELHNPQWKEPPVALKDDAE